MENQEKQLLEARIAELEAQTAALKAAKRSLPGELRVSEKGALSIYGVQRFPVTLYASGWESILNRADEIRAFITAHPELKRKA